MIVIGDVHGCIKTLEALLKKLPDDEICFVGDLIDRGPDSAGIIELVRKEGFHCVRGNHEQMAIDVVNSGELEDEDYPLMKLSWLRNGGGTCISSFDSNKDIFEAIIWMESLPIYKEFPNCINDDGRHLVVSHSFVGNMWKHLPTSKHLPLEKVHEKILWDRPFKFKDNKDIYNIFGHTPILLAKVKSFYANIDTGCYYKNNGYGTLTAIQYPEMKIFTQENLDL